MRTWLAIALIFLVSGTGFGQTVPPLLNDGEIWVPSFQPTVPAGPTPFQQEDLHERLQELLDDSVYSRLGGIGTILAVDIPGEPLWIGSVGYASRGSRSLRDENGRLVRDEWRGIAREGDVRIEPDDPFYIASCSKVFVAALILTLVDDGILTLDDTLQQWLPEVSIPNAERITIRQLLNHTGGVFDYTSSQQLWLDMLNNPSLQYTPWELVETILGQPAVFEPGERNQWSYSNSGYLLSGLIVERALDQPLAEALRERILEPFGVEGIASASLEPTPEVRAVGHNSLHQPELFFDMSWSYGAGHLVSTAEQLTRFLTLLLRDRQILSPASFDAMFDTVPVSSYGLGIGVVPIDEGPLQGTLYNHTGRIPGYTSIYFHHEESGVTVVQFHNGDSDNEPFYLPLTIAELALIDAVQVAGSYTEVETWSLY